MNAHQRQWSEARDELVGIITQLGFPGDFGNEIAKELGSPKAIRRMSSYLRQARPRDVESVVDEMLAIRSEIDSWKNRKKSEEANSRYNDVLRYGLDNEE
ncbi:MAG: hypothetical protein E7Z64_03550 [Thermoplasmata archaeon]|jgi:hypothetical protein|nr:hypothetical protein [Thermoplasmata archaeon]